MVVIKPDYSRDGIYSMKTIPGAKRIYEREGILLIEGDCLEVLPHLSGVDAVVTDPPYDLDTAQGDKGCFAVSYRKVTSPELQAISDSYDIDAAFSEWARLGSHTWFCFCSNSQIPTIMNAAKMRGYAPTLLVWHKYNSVPFSHGTWRQDAEFYIHAKKPKAPLNGNATIKSKVKRYPLCGECPEHPTTKPVALISDCISIGTEQGETVLDPFLGSGTTAIACIRTGRKCIGIEREPRYFDIAVARVEAELNQGDLFRQRNDA